MAGQELICRLCLNVPTGLFQKINFSELDMLKFVRLYLYMSVTHSPIICSQCLETLQQSYDFKMVCRKTENFLNRVYDTKERTKLDLKYLILSNNEDRNKGENEGVCRFCLGYLERSSSMGLDNLNEDIFLKDMIHKCLPEFDLDITEQPAMCLDCSEKLQTLFNFMMACQDNDEKIKRKVFVDGIDSRGFVRLSDVLKFVDDMNNGDVRPLEGENIMSFVKVETIEVETDDTVSKVEVFDNKIVDEFGEFIQLKGEGATQFEETEADKSKYEVPPIVKVKRELEETKEDINRHEIAPKIKINILQNVKRTRRGRPRRTINPPKRYPCMHCDLTMNSQMCLVNHLRNIHQDTCCLYKCDQCDFVTTHPDDLQTHNSHFMHVLHQCDRCEFTSPYGEVKCSAHYRSKRSYKSVFKCEVCSIRFSKQIYLDGHILTQHPEHESLIMSQVYHCETCQLKTVHKEDWLPHNCVTVSYDCDQCTFSATLLLTLESHKNVMHKYSCELCQKTFSSKVDLAKHKRGHLGYSDFGRTKRR